MSTHDPNFIVQEEKPRNEERNLGLANATSQAMAPEELKISPALGDEEMLNDIERKERNGSPIRHVIYQLKNQGRPKRSDASNIFVCFLYNMN